MLTLESFIARIGGCSTGKGPPVVLTLATEQITARSNNLLVWPVAIDVTANAGACRNSLSVLSPQSVGCLGVNEAYRLLKM